MNPGKPLTLQDLSLATLRQMLTATQRLGGPDDATVEIIRRAVEARGSKEPAVDLTPAPPAFFGVGPDEVLFCPACKRGGPANLAPRRPDGVFHCPLCTGLLTPLLVPPTPDAVYFPGMEDAAPGDPTPEIKT